MKRHATKKHIKTFGLFLGLVALGLVGVKGVCAEKKVTEEVDVKFTFNSTLSMTVSGESMLIGEVTPGNTGESDELTVKVETNSTSGYYLAATAGSADKQYTDLKHEEKESVFKSMDVSAGVSDLKEAEDSSWGFRYAIGADADLSSSKYNGLPLDASDEGQTGSRLVDAENSDGDNTVKCNIGVKAGPGMEAGTYTNVINFYAVAK